MMRISSTTAIALTVALCTVTAWTLDRKAIVQHNEGAAVVIWGTNPATGAELQGSGCCVHPAGYVLTVAHQVLGLTAFRARLRDGSERKLTLIEVDKLREVALLKADSPMAQAARIGNADTLQSGADLVAIAAPLGLEFSAVTGIVSSTNRTRGGYPMIQADIPASPGSSGAPVFDEKGELVGLIVSRLEQGEWIKTITPINNAYAMLRVHRIPIPGDLALPVDAEIIPAHNVTHDELQAIKAYNAGVLADSPAEKVASYTRAAALLPKFFEAWFNLAVAHTASDNLMEAVAAYRQAQALNPSQAKAVAVQRNLGRLYLRERRCEEAIACFRQAAQLAPSDPSSFNDLGEAYRRAEQFERAEQCFLTALELRPTYRAAHYNLGLTYASGDKAPRAIEQFERYLELAAGAPDADQVRQWIAELRGRQ